MPAFVLIFRQGPHPLSDADKTRRQQEVSVWARAQNAAGHRLEPRILAPEAAQPATNPDDGTAGTWPVTALLFAEACDLAEATQLAESHPANRFGASVEVRPWAPPVVPAANPPAP